ncbi:hypothetical protein GYB29_02715 [bacterium]|nr:hypothetical protein [bacterium]
MKALIYFVSIIFFLNGCGLLNSKNDKEDPLYDWVEITKFKSEWINAIATNGENELYVANEDVLNYSNDGGKTFQSFSTPDSVHIKKIRVYESLYMIGDVLIENGGVFLGFTNYVYVSDDNGRNWEEITGGYIMQDLVVSKGNLHIGRKHGVTTFDLEGDSVLYRNSFINSKLSDHIEEITASEEGIIYLASHDGIHSSEDDGKNWNSISSDIDKDDDFIRSISIDEQNEIIYAAESDRIYFKEKNASFWEKTKVNIGTQLVRSLRDSKVIAADSDEVFLAQGKDFNFENIGPFYEETEYDFLNFEYLEVFSDNKIVVGGYFHLFIGSPVSN